jgi:hypothetical protein
MAESKGFLERWSRRKQDARAGLLPVEARPEPAVAPRSASELTPSARELPPAAKPEAAAGPASHPVPVPAPDAAAVGAVASQAQPFPAPTVEQQAPPTLDEAQALTPESDFSRFVGVDVSPDVKHVAMRKLFSDPHFNVMDGLDIYIEDYNKPDPLPLDRLRLMASAKVLGLVQEADEPADKPADQNVEIAEETPTYVDPDLRLQQDHAAGPQDAGDSARGNTDAA